VEEKEVNDIERGFEAFRKEAGERIAQLEAENAELKADKDAFFRHNSILVELMTDEQKKKALDVLMSRKEAQS
jgi:hypothetical protein